ncbi:hypothetical protein GO499_02985 [Algicella marina]|uniref:Uncharacterized protein n=1 Tax=Algicella marina TaxID=2683284 RepID=A0A6P1SWU3_9RHOB|nr:hypothetical protein GO499_02985 [Algicella marina]
MPEKQAEGVYVRARLNARVQPIDRGEYFEDPLDEFLREAGLGEVTGGGTQMAEEPAGIEFCDVEIRLTDDSDETVALLIGHLEGLGAPMGSRLIREGSEELPFGVLEGLGLFLNGTDLDEEIYSTSDVNHVITECQQLIAQGDSFRGHWQGSRETALYFYGPSFAEMRAAIEGFVAEYPLCQRARIEQIA